MKTVKELLGFLAGLGVAAAFLYYFCVGPMRRIRRARTWQARACIILSSGVEESTSDPGLYGIRVTYQYKVGGRFYTSSRYSFSNESSKGGFSAGRTGKNAIVKRLSPGTKTLCYVDPADPTEAVINRRVTLDIVIAGIVLGIIFGGVALSAWYDIR